MDQTIGSWGAYNTLISPQKKSIILKSFSAEHSICIPCRNLPKWRRKVKMSICHTLRVDELSHGGHATFNYTQEFISIPQIISARFFFFNTMMVGLYHTQLIVVVSEIYWRLTSENGSMELPIVAVLYFCLHACYIDIITNSCSTGQGGIFPNIFTISWYLKCILCNRSPWGYFCEDI